MGKLKIGDNASSQGSFHHIDRDVYGSQSGEDGSSGNFLYKPSSYSHSISAPSPLIGLPEFSHLGNSYSTLVRDSALIWYLTTFGCLLQLNSGKVIVVGPGTLHKSGKDKLVVLWSIHDHISTLVRDSTNPSGSIVKNSDSASLGPRGIIQRHTNTIKDVQFHPTMSWDHSVCMFDQRNLISYGVGSPVHKFEHKILRIMCSQIEVPDNAFPGKKWKYNVL
ncbi:hypothetical protein L1887_38642 [Cichorium endivia]|nr:hypothetical protein L1887_38642 [Cichorium endivia]